MKEVRDRARLARRPPQPHRRGHGRDHARRDRALVRALARPLTVDRWAVGRSPVARPLPPFTDEHEQLRESIRRFIDNELRPHAPGWEDARWFPNDVFTRMAELGFLGLKYPEEYGGQGGDYLHDAVLAEELSRCGSGGLAAGIGAHISIATPPIWKFGTEDQKRRWLAPAIARREDRGARHHRARRGLGRARASARAPRRSTAATSSTARRRSSRTACARTSSSRAVKTTEEGGHHGISLPRDREGHGGLQRVAQAGEARLARLRHRRAGVRRRVRAGREPARRGEQGLLPDHGQLPVGAADHGARLGGRDAGHARPHDPVRARARDLRQADREAPGDPPQARRDGREGGDRPRADLPRAAPVRRWPATRSAR